MNNTELSMIKTLIMMTVCLVSAMFLQHEILEVQSDFEALGIECRDLIALEVIMHILTGLSFLFTINFVRLAIKIERAR